MLTVKFMTIYFEVSAIVISGSTKVHFLPSIFFLIYLFFVLSIIISPLSSGSHNSSATTAPLLDTSVGLIFRTTHFNFSGTCASGASVRTLEAEPASIYLFCLSHRSKSHITYPILAILCLFAEKATRVLVSARHQSRYFDHPFENAAMEIKSC